MLLKCNKCNYGFVRTKRKGIKCPLCGSKDLEISKHNKKYICLGRCRKEFDEPYCPMNSIGICDPRCPHCGSVDFELIE